MISKVLKNIRSINNHNPRGFHFYLSIRLKGREISWSQFDFYIFLNRFLRDKNKFFVLKFTLSEGHLYVLRWHC